ncbi:hypothetical protein [Nonomuraea bangladeshensis]|uniref:hypothetical protein n=1 Tax=Nonomuraea bangladeshensis TaxID=404385 RepID=UPI003C3001DB
MTDSPITAADVAEFLAAADNVIADELGGKVGLHAAKSTVHIEVTPRRATASGSDVGQENAVRFVARVFPVEPATPAAAEPVHLAPEIARELTYLSPGENHEGWTVVDKEEDGHTRWESHHSLIIRNEAGEHFQGHYRKGLTEYQDTKPWEYEKTARFDPVVRRPRVVQVFDWVTPAKDAGATLTGS